MLQHQASFEAIGTKWHIKLLQEQAGWLELLELIHNRINQFDQAYSRFRSGTLVSNMSLAAGKYGLPSDGYKMLDFYHHLYMLTEGKITPLIGQVMVDSGYDAQYSFQKKALHPAPAWEEVIEYSRDMIEVKQPALLDFGAAGKGYLVDIVSDIISSSGIGEYLINAGGDILHRSKANKPLSVGLENPLDMSEVVGVARLCNRSLCASSGSRRKWSGMNHIIDPISLTSPISTIATWVIADDTMTADGLATALYFTDAEYLQQYFEFDWAKLDSKMFLQYSKGFPVELFQGSAA